MNTDEVLSQLNPKLRKKIVRSSEIETPPKIKVPSIGLEAALDGGFQLGRQVLVWGNKSAGKSSMCLQMIGEAQRAGYVCAYLDAEMTYDIEWAKRLGVDTEALLHSETRTINEMVDVAVSLMEAGVDVIVIDSISALLPAAYFEKGSGEMKELENTKQIGAESRDFSNAWKMINYANNKTKPTLIVAISQGRNKIGQMYTQFAPQGGHATQYYSSTIVKLFSSESEKQAIERSVTVGDKIVKQKVGRKVRWEVTFNKTGAGFATGEYDFIFRGDDVGVDNVGELVDVAVQNGVIKRAGAWFTVPGVENTVQGQASVVKLLKDDESIQNLVRQKVMEQ